MLRFPARCRAGAAQGDVRSSSIPLEAAPESRCSFIPDSTQPPSALSSFISPSFVTNFSPFSACPISLSHTSLHLCRIPPRVYPFSLLPMTGRTGRALNSHFPGTQKSHFPALCASAAPTLWAWLGSPLNRSGQHPSIPRQECGHLTRRPGGRKEEGKERGKVTGMGSSPFPARAHGPGCSRAALRALYLRARTPGSPSCRRGEIRGVPSLLPSAPGCQGLPVWPPSSATRCLWKRPWVRSPRHLELHCLLPCRAR